MIDTAPAMVNKLYKVFNTNNDNNNVSLDAEHKDI